MEFTYIKSESPEIEDDIIEAEGTQFHIQIFDGTFIVQEEQDNGNIEDYAIQEHGTFATLQEAKDKIISIA